MPSSRLRIAVCDHNNAALPFVRALHHAGHEIVTEGADALLIDFDPPLESYRRMIDKHSRAGAKVILYPHGAGGPNLSYDGLWEPYERVDANIVNGCGTAEFLRRLEYPSPVHTIGWSFSEPAPFKPCANVKHVVFAPTHTNSDGSIAEERRALNGEVYAKLLAGPWR